MEHIRAAHAENGTFHNVNPSKQNWITGFVGISGVAINCVANYDSARVEFYLGAPDKEKNKARFDALYSHKSEIEEALGTHLEWLRSDDTKASFILCRLTDVGLTDESSWETMAKFHAEWSKKFYDVILPYIDLA